MPSPAAMMPLSTLPLLGTIAPIATAVFGPSETPVAGFTATRLAAGHGLAATAQPGM